MSYSELLNRLGFVLDPFAKTNADEEEHLNEYFVPPPFFSAVYGDFNTPKSCSVFAPRGGGKTALKREIELSSKTTNFLCITYNFFNTLGLSLKDITLAYHLQNLVQSLLVGVITGAQTRGIQNLSNEDRHLLYLMTKEHLSKISQSQLKETISSIKNYTDTALEFWNKFTGPIGMVINGLLEKIGIGKTEIKQFETAGGKLGTLYDQLKVLQSLARKLGYTSATF